MKKQKKKKDTPPPSGVWTLGVFEPAIKVNPLEGEFVLFVLLENGLAIGAMPVRIDTDDINIKEVFEELCKKPMVGKPRRPQSLILDNRIKGLFINLTPLGLPVEVARTKEVDEFIQGMEEYESTKKNEGFDYEEYPEPLMQRFFTLTAQWIKLALWKKYSSDELIQISSKKYNLDG